MSRAEQSVIYVTVYKNPGIVPADGKNTMHCDYTTYPPADKVCFVDPKEWGTCSSENHYSYHKSAPCIFLKLNKVTQAKLFAEANVFTSKNQFYINFN